jgi:hypothetical protein
MFTRKAKYNKLNAVSLYRHAMLERMSQVNMPSESSATQHWLYQANLMLAASHYLSRGDRYCAAQVLRHIDADIRQYLLLDFSDPVIFARWFDSFVDTVEFPQYEHSICCHSKMCNDIQPAQMTPQGYRCLNCRVVLPLTWDDAPLI